MHLFLLLLLPSAVTSHSAVAIRLTLHNTREGIQEDTSKSQHSQTAGHTAKAAKQQPAHTISSCSTTKQAWQKLAHCTYRMSYCTAGP
jgi:hypothetical protein